MNPVSITGLGILTPLLHQPGEVLTWADQGFPFPGSEVSGMISIPGVDPKELRQMSKLTRMSLYSALALLGGICRQMGVYRMADFRPIVCRQIVELLCGLYGQLNTIFHSGHNVARSCLFVNLSGERRGCADWRTVRGSPVRTSPWLGFGFLTSATWG